MYRKHAGRSGFAKFDATGLGRLKDKFAEYGFLPAVEGAMVRHIKRLDEFFRHTIKVDLKWECDRELWIVNARIEAPADETAHLAVDAFDGKDHSIKKEGVLFYSARVFPSDEPKTLVRDAREVFSAIEAVGGILGFDQEKALENRRIIERYGMQTGDTAHHGQRIMRFLARQAGIVYSDFLERVRSDVHLCQAMEKVADKE